MDHELWSQLSHAMADVARAFPRSPRQTFGIHRIIRVYLWAVLHDRPTVWACRPSSWPGPNRPTALPDQSTMSRRLRTPQAQRFLAKLARRVAGPAQPSLVKALDGKPLVIAKHTADPDATSGRGVGGFAKGYKLHAIWGRDAMPLAWSVRPLNVSEVAEARELIGRLNDEGYLLGASTEPSTTVRSRQTHHQRRQNPPTSCIIYASPRRRCPDSGEPRRGDSGIQHRRHRRPSGACFERSSDTGGLPFDKLRTGAPGY